MSEDYLAHHGVLGMKWGVRRYQPYGGGTYEPEHRGRFVGKNGAKGNVSSRSIQKPKSAKKQARLDEKAYKRDYKRAEKAYNRALKKNPEAPEYAKVQAQKASELSKSKKTEAFRNAMTNHTEFTLDDVANYNDEVARIGKKYKNQTVNAVMKDLKIEDTKGARAFVEKMVESEYSLDDNDKRVIVPHH